MAGILHLYGLTCYIRANRVDQLDVSYQKRASYRPVVVFFGGTGRNASMFYYTWVELPMLIAIFTVAFISNNFSISSAFIFSATSFIARSMLSTGIFYTSDCSCLELHSADIKNAEMLSLVTWFSSTVRYRYMNQCAMFLFLQYQCTSSQLSTNKHYGIFFIATFIVTFINTVIHRRCPKLLEGAIMECM